MLRQILIHPLFLLALFIVNVAGTLYGYWWYKAQLIDTPALFLIFVPDSPTASLFFCVFLYFFMQGKNAPYIEALAIITLFKYGIWAVAMNLLTLAVEGELVWQGYMLIASHGAMAVQGLLYASYYKFRFKHLLVATIWTFHNDVIDYVYGMMPRYSSLYAYMEHIGYFTFWLSILSVCMAYFLVIQRKTFSVSKRETT